MGRELLIPEQAYSKGLGRNGVTNSMEFWEKFVGAIMHGKGSMKLPRNFAQSLVLIFSVFG